MDTDRTARVVRAAEVDLESPGRRDYLVALPHDSIWGDHLVPLTVFVGPGALPGRGVVAFGATHGDEYEGPIALAHLRREISPADVLGRPASPFPACGSYAATRACRSARRTVRMAVTPCPL